MNEPRRTREVMLFLTAVSVGAVISLVVNQPVLAAVLFVLAVGIGRTEYKWRKEWKE